MKEGDYESKVLDSNTAKRMEDAGQDLFGESYNHALGYGYRMAQDNETVESAVNIIAKDEKVSYIRLN